MFCFQKNILHHSTIQALYKTNLHLWFDQTHLLVLYYSVILIIHMQIHEFYLAYTLL